MCLCVRVCVWRRQDEACSAAAYTQCASCRASVGLFRRRRRRRIEAGLREYTFYTRYNVSTALRTYCTDRRTRRSNEIAQAQSIVEMCSSRRYAGNLIPGMPGFETRHTFCGSEFDLNKYLNINNNNQGLNSKNITSVYSF